MDKQNSLKIMIGDISQADKGICITFIIQLPEASTKFISYLKYTSIKHHNHLTVLDIAWDAISTDVDNWLDAQPLCSELATLRNTEYKPKYKSQDSQEKVPTQTRSWNFWSS